MAWKKWLPIAQVIYYMYIRTRVNNIWRILLLTLDTYMHSKKIYIHTMGMTS